MSDQADTRGRNVDDLVRIARYQGRAEAYRDIARDARKAGAIDYAKALEAEAGLIEKAMAEPEWMTSWAAAQAAGRRAELDQREAYEPTDPKHPDYRDTAADWSDSRD